MLEQGTDLRCIPGFAKTSMKRTGHKTFAAYSRYVDVNKDSIVEANKQWDNLSRRS